MNLLITGGAGFIGSFFVKYAVLKGYNISVIDKLTYAGDLDRIKEVIDKINFYKADIVNEEFINYIFSKERPFIVVHFAAETHVDRSILEPKTFIRSNIEGTFVLLEACRRYKVEKFINIITDEVYGEIIEGKFTENSPLIPNSPYSVSKACQDMLGRAYLRTYQIPVITVRPSNNYGPWQYPEKLIPVVIAKALKDEKIPVYGDGSNVREWLFVEDCVEALLTIVEKGKIGEIYNIGSGIEKKNIEVIRMLLKLLGKSENLISFVRDRPGHDYRYSISNEKIKQDLNWYAKTSLEEGLEKTVNWYINKKDWLFNKISRLREYWEKVYI